MGVSNKELYDIFIGSGALSFSWWVKARENFQGIEAPEEWELRGVIGGSADEGDTYRYFRFNANHLRVVILAIGTGRIAYIPFDSSVARECRLLEDAPSTVDFDAAMADMVLQVAADGCLTYS